MNLKKHIKIMKENLLTFNLFFIFFRFFFSSTFLLYLLSLIFSPKFLKTKHSPNEFFRQFFILNKYLILFLMSNFIVANLSKSFFPFKKLLLIENFKLSKRK